MAARSRRPMGAGGWRAVAYALGKACEVGPLRLWRRMRARNACKTCAFGMGGQKGGMANETGHGFEVCKKSLQAQAADMGGTIPDDFFATHDVAALAALNPRQAEAAGRLTTPLLLEDGAERFTPVGWDQALDEAAAALTRTAPERVAFYASGRSSNEAAFLLQAFARVYGTNHVMNCSFYCHQASGVALKMAVGSGTSTIELADLARADLVVLAGANPASNHPRLMTQLTELRARGGKVIVVNPLREAGLERWHAPTRLRSMLFGTEIASLYVQPLAGGDVALFVGVLKALLEREAVDHVFLERCAEGASQALDDARGADWERITAAAGVARGEIRAMAAMIAEARAAIFAWGMGLTHHASGVDNILALANIALATGNIGRPGAGLLPIRGHSNIQGVGSVGFVPVIPPAMRTMLEGLAGEGLAGRPLPTAQGFDTQAMLQAAAEGRIDALVTLGGNLWGSSPDSAAASAALGRVGTVIALNTKLNPGHIRGRGRRTLVLPVLARDEERQATSQESMFNFVRLSEGGSPNVPGSQLAETEIVADLAARVLGSSPVDWRKLADHGELRRLMAAAIPGWQAVAALDAGGPEFTIAGRILHAPRFATPSGKARLHPTPIPEPVAEGALRLVTLRSEGQFNTVVYEEHDLYRGIPHRNAILVSAADAARLGLAEGDRVRVRGEAGSLDGVEVFVRPLRPGVAAMYYPEANILMAPRLDARSRTPSFKSAPVWISSAPSRASAPSAQATLD